MQYKFFGIPAADAEQAEADLNRFVRGHRVITVHRELVREAGAAYWALCVEYLEGAGGSASGKAGGRPRVDYAEAARHVEPLIAFVRHGRSEEMRRRILARL